MRFLQVQVVLLTLRALLFLLNDSVVVVDALAASPLQMIYGVPHSGWSSPQWNWGSAVGTGHDCAKICRQRYDSRPARRELVDQLLQAANTDDIDFEEIKLVLALAWQRGRWDGSDGGPNGGYGEVLQLMARAQRYEEGGDEAECSARLVQDMQSRYHLLNPSSEQVQAMARLDYGDGDATKIRTARSRCAGLVLQAMGFVENGC